MVLKFGIILWTLYLYNYYFKLFRIFFLPKLNGTQISPHYNQIEAIDIIQTNTQASYARYSLRPTGSRPGCKSDYD